MTDVESKLRQDITAAPDADPLFGPATSELMRYLASIAMTAAATVVAVGVDTKVSIPNLSLVFVIPVIVAGLSLGLGPSLCSAILGALAFNFFLTEPRYSLAVDDAANIWAIGLLLVVGLIVSGVAFTSRQRATEAARLRRQATVLQGYSRDVVAADNANAIASITFQALAALFQVPVVVMLVTEGRVVFLEQVGDVEPQEAELEAARSSLATGTVARSDVFPNLASRFDFWPVQTAERSECRDWISIRPGRTSCGTGYAGQHRCTCLGPGAWPSTCTGWTRRSARKLNPRRHSGAARLQQNVARQFMVIGWCTPLNKFGGSAL